MKILKKIFKKKREYDYCARFSMVPEKHFSDLQIIVDDINKQKLKGACVECGVWKGGCIMWIMTCQKKYDNNINMYLYDTYEGMTYPDSYKDLPNKLSKDPIKNYKEKWCYCSIEDVKKNVNTINYPNKNIFYIKGDICETLDIPENIPESISILRLDTDFYSSTKKELEVLFPKVLKGGWIIIDDYYCWNGSHEATNEFIDKNKDNIIIKKLNCKSRLYLKKK